MRSWGRERDYGAFLVAIMVVVLASFVGCLAALVLVSAFWGLFA